MSMFEFKKSIDAIPMLVAVAKLGFPREINDKIFNLVVEVEKKRPKFNDSDAENVRIVVETCRTGLALERMVKEKHQSIKKLLQTSYTEIERAGW